MASSEPSSQNLQSPKSSPWRTLLLGQKKEEAVAFSKLVHFFVDVEATKKSGHLFLEFKYQERLKSGDWGALKPGRFTPAALTEFTSTADREIFGLLFSPLNTEKVSYRSKTEDRSFEVDDLLTPILLPILLAKPAVRLHIGETALELGRETWTFELQVVEEKFGLRLEGLLVRGRERVALKESLALIESGYLLFKNSIECISWGSNYALARHLFNHSISVPRSDEVELIMAGARNESLPALRLPPTLQWPLRDVRPFAVARFQSSSELKLSLRVSCVYGKSEISFNESSKIVYEVASRTRMKRDAKMERAFLKVFDKGLAGVPSVIEDVGASSILISELQNAGWLVLVDGKPVAPFLRTRGTLRQVEEEFALEATFEFEGEGRVSLQEFVRASARGERFSKLGERQLGVVPDTWLERANLLLRGGSFDHEGRLRFKKVSLPIFKPVFSEVENLVVDDNVTRIFNGLANLLESGITEKPRELKANLRPYQAEGLAWLDKIAKSGFGGILADDMGLGKTVQVIAYLLRRATLNRPQEYTGPRPSLVVLPKSLVFNWQAEIEKFGPRLRVLDFAAGNRGMLKANDYDVVITTYHILKNEIDRFEKFEFDSVILDEAQTIKNPSSQIAKACFQLRGRHKFALTGTPIENSLGDLFSLMKFANPGLIPTGLEISVRGGRMAALTTEATKKLAVAVSPFILRRTKKQVLKELPDKSEQTLVCELEGEQKRMYEKVRKQFRDSLKAQKENLQRDSKATRMQVFEALLRLRQICCHPGLVEPALVTGSSAKFEMLLEHLEEIQASGQKALIFSQFTSLLNLLKPKLEAGGIRFEYLDGQTRDRGTVVERFNGDAETTVFLISLKAGGTGLNLTTASYVFLLDPWWNPAVEAQAIDRAYRMGQKQKVMAYRLIAQGTIEEKILKMQAQKRSLAESVISDDQAFLRNLSVDDLAALLEE